MIEYNKTFDDNSMLPFFKKPQNDPARGHAQFCYILIVNLFIYLKREIAHENKKFLISEILNHYLKGMCNITSYYGIFTVEIVSPKPNHATHQIQTDDIDIKIFHRLYKKYTTPKLTKSSFIIHKR